MLILTRRIGETLVIGDDIRIVVCGVSGDQIRLGIDAPRDVPVHRQEIAERIKAGVAREDGPRAAAPGETADTRRQRFLARRPRGD